MNQQSLKSILSLELLAESAASDDPVSTDKANRQLLDNAWTGISKNFSIDSPMPVVFIVGAGAGAPRAQALRNMSQHIFHRIHCLYDVSHLSLNRINDLIEECHQWAQPTIVIYITQPLIKSAKNVIAEMIAAGIVPSASEFALSHFNSLSTLIALTQRHKKKTSLFAASVIEYERAQLHHHNNLRLFNQTNTDLAVYEQQFVAVWKAQRRRQQRSSRQALVTIKPAHAPKKLKILNQTASSHLKIYLNFSFPHSSKIVERSSLKTATFRQFCHFFTGCRVLNAEINDCFRPI